MRRAFVGAMIGGGATFLTGLTAGLVTIKAQPDNLTAGLFLAAILAGNGAMAGAIVGGVGDLLAYLREALPIRHGPEADYRDPDPPAG
jgi:hypothetical protein